MDFPLSMLLLLCVIFMLIGAVLMLLLQYYVFIKISDMPEQSEEQKDIHVKYSLPLTIQQTARIVSPSAISSAPDATPPNDELVEAPPLLAVNFVMQFLFHELKNSNRVRKWFYRKLCVELDELLSKTTTGKLFDKLTIRELELGDQFPEIKALRVHNVELNETEGRIENLDLLLQLKYKGNFRTSIDADMVLGKKGSLTLKVKQLSGLARLQFTRNPYTHWSLSFLGDPELDLQVESKYQGRQMQSNITSLITNQIRKAVRRKHTLPNYKLRYKPFFHKSPEEDATDGDIIPNGQLGVKVSEISRLMCPTHILSIYCTLTMASLAFVEARQKDDRNVIVSLDVEIRKAKNQQIGIVFKQSSDQFVEIENVLLNTPAWKSNLKAGDILLAIEGKRITSIQHVAKVIKSLQSPVFRMRIERIIPGIIRNDAILEDLELYEDLGDNQIGYSSTAKSIPSDLELNVKNQITRNNSAEKGTSSESSLCNTPTNSPKKTKLIAKALKKTISRENSEHLKDDESKLKSKLLPKIEYSRPKTPTPTRMPGEGLHDVEHYYQHSTIDCELSRLIHMEDLSSFMLNPNYKFLNICVYGKSLNESLLLGFVNIPISQILADCSETSLVQCIKRFELNPPIPQDLKTHGLFNQSGFNANLCFGDILLAFTWDGNPNLSTSETITKQSGKSKNKSTVIEDSGFSDNISIKSSSDTLSTTSIQSSAPRAHNFVRTHFQRATQCDFCGKKIWLKDAAQCRECSMSCHKKCITKCQNSTVCGPVDCSNTLQSGTNAPNPEFTVTEAIDYDAEDCEKLLAANAEDDANLMRANTPGLEVHRSSLTGLFAEGIKRVNSANNLAIPGIVSSLTGSGGNTPGNISNAKSLPPSPQHSPSRKASLINIIQGNPFDIVTQRLEAIPSDVTSVSAEQINLITEPILSISKDEDVMTLAKNTSRNLYTNIEGSKRVEKINILLSKLRLALDSETAIHSSFMAPSKSDANDISPKKNKASAVGKSEERVQALSVIMLYLCTGLQHAQGVALQ